MAKATKKKAKAKRATPKPVKGSKSTSVKQTKTQVEPQQSDPLHLHIVQYLLAGTTQSLTSVVNELKKAELGDILKTERQRIEAAILTDSKPTAQACNISRSVLASSLTLGDYYTLDQQHINDIRAVAANIRAYAKDPSRERPLNILMLASPGAGKSHFINCLAQSLETEGIRSHTYNMTAMERNEDLAHPLDAARNLKVQDHLPLLFLDEFDSSPDNYATLLPLLWDGDIHLGHRDLKLGKVIIVLAGSKADLPTIISTARSMQSKGDDEAPDSKLVDLLSRINGGEILIPGLDDVDAGRDRRIDKICIAIGLLKRRFGAQLDSAPRSLLRFIATTQFRYGVRSIAHLIDIIPYKKAAKSLSKTQLKLPVTTVIKLKKSSLAYHIIHVDQAHGIVEQWKKCSRHDCSIAFGRQSLFEQLNKGRAKH